MDTNTKTIKKCVKAFSQAVQKNISVQKIMLFGSYARGTQKPESDVDILVVSKDFENIKPFKRAVPLYRYWKPLVPIDIICYTPEEFERLAKRITIAREAQREGIEI